MPQNHANRGGFGEYPRRRRSALRILDERATKEVKDVLKRKRLRAKRSRRHARPSMHGSAAEGGGVGGERLAVGAAARRVLCNQSCFGASEFAGPAFDRRGNACSAIVIVRRRPSAVSPPVSCVRACVRTYGP